ncbi:unnamed protein product [Orchesella dallaii]|uniref:L-Fucosyltransferase n=1 Tax=Orchesella dallaii TaxID=48710 RepID=A0ABP1R701_9HEXA
MKQNKTFPLYSSIASYGFLICCICFITWMTLALVSVSNSLDNNNTTSNQYTFDTPPENFNLFQLSNDNNETQHSIRSYFNTTLIPPGVILRPQGGIGNQLFEYACSYALAKERNWPLYIVLRKFHSRGFSATQRDFALDLFNIPLNNVIDESTTKIPNNFLEYVNDQNLLENRGNLKPHGFVQHSGYCQSEAYWRNWRDELIPMFQPHVDIDSLKTSNKKLESILKLIEGTESVAVHVRRGDFTTYNGFFVPTSYQRQAIRKIVKLLQLRGKTPVFFVFSDNIQYTKEKLRDFNEKYEFHYVSALNTTSIQDFYLMTQCKHIIIPNSTFGWWSAYLNKNPDKIVIASAFNPKFWKLWAGENREFYKKLHGTLYHPSSWHIYQRVIKKRSSWIGSHNHNDSSKVNPWNRKTLTHIWNFFPPAFNCPFMLERVGRLGHGGKWICGLELYEYSPSKVSNIIRESPEECTIYIFGGDDLTIEKELVRRADCQIFIFDRKSNKAYAHPRVEVIPEVKISDKNEKEENTLYNILKENDHGWLDIMVMDIQGRELKVLEQIAEDFDVLPFGQLQVEIHLPKQDKDDKGRHKIFQNFKKWFERMEAKGLRPFFSEANLFQGCINGKKESSNTPNVMEYSFINLRGKHLLVQGS